MRLDIRFTVFAFLCMLFVACGAQQAPLVTTSVTTQPVASAAPAVSTAPASTATAALSRGRGNPNAPVKLIEFSDFQ